MSVLRLTRPLWTHARRALYQNTRFSAYRPAWALTKTPQPTVCFTTSHSAGSAGSAPGGSSDNYIVTSPWGSYPVPDVTINDLLLNRFSEAPDKIALIESGTEETFTYGQLGDIVRALSASLSKQGISHGDKVLVSSPNTLEMALLLLAVPVTGACIAVMSPHLSKGDVEKLLDKGPMDFLITKPELLPNFADRSTMFKKECSTGELLTCAAFAHCRNAALVFTIGEVSGYTSVRQLMQEGDPAQMPRPNLNPRTDPALIVYSSGTTGLPKGVLLSHYNLVSAVTATSMPSLHCEFFTADDTIVNVFPLAHIGGITVSFLNAVYSLTTFILPEHFNFEDFLKLNEKYKATSMILPPPVGVRLLTDPTCMDDYNLSSVRKMLSGAAPISAYVQEGLCKRYNLSTFRQVYGMSEVAGVSHADHKTQFKYGSAGLLLPNMSAKIVDPMTGEDLPSTSSGEIYMRGPQVMLGYLNNPHATADIMTSDGWVQSGDIGHYDEEGSLFITDRCKDLIKYKGLQVAPAELEGVILGHPLVADVGVIGVPDDRAGEVPLAFIVLQPGTKHDGKTERHIAQYVANRVSNYKQLRGGIKFVPEIPKLLSGKILKRVLRQMAKAD